MTRLLYTTDILRLAASLSDPHELEHEDGCAEVRSPTCGSRVRLTVQLDEYRRVERLSMQVHACAFGQASAALVTACAPAATWAVTSSMASTTPTVSCWLRSTTS